MQSAAVGNFPQILNSGQHKKNGKKKEKKIRIRNEREQTTMARAIPHNNELGIRSESRRGTPLPSCSSLEVGVEPDR